MLSPGQQEFLLDSFGYVASKPYPKPTAQGLAPMRGYIWTGFKNAARAFLYTNAQVVATPRAAVKGWSYNGNLNAPAYAPPTGGAFSGETPTRGVFTGVGE